MGSLLILAMFVGFVIWAALYVRPQSGFGLRQEFPGVQPRFQHLRDLVKSLRDRWLKRPPKVVP